MTPSSSIPGARSSSFRTSSRGAHELLDILDAHGGGLDMALLGLLDRAPHRADLRRLRALVGSRVELEDVTVEVIHGVEPLLGDGPYLGAGVPQVAEHVGHGRYLRRLPLACRGPVRPLCASPSPAGRVYFPRS